MTSNATLAALAIAQNKASSHKDALLDVEREEFLAGSGRLVTEAEEAAIDAALDQEELHADAESAEAEAQRALMDAQVALADLLAHAPTPLHATAGDRKGTSGHYVTDRGLRIVSIGYPRQKSKGSFVDIRDISGKTWSVSVSLVLTLSTPEGKPLGQAAYADIVREHRLAVRKAEALVERCKLVVAGNLKTAAQPNV